MELKTKKEHYRNPKNGHQDFKAERDIHDKKIEIASAKEKQFSKVVRWVSSVVDREDAPRYGEDYLKSYSENKAPVLTKKNDLI